MADMQPDQPLESSATPATPSPSGGAKGGSQKSAKAAEKAGQTAETVRQKGHDLAETARSGVDSVTGKIETAGDFAQRAQEMISMAEQRLDQFIDVAEKLFEKGTKYTGTAKTFLDNNRQYKEKLEGFVTKYHEFTGRFGQKLQSRDAQGESEGLGDKASDALSTAKAKGREQAGRLGDTARSSLRSTGTYVKENPAEAVLVGAAVGVLIGTAFRHMRTEEVPAGRFYEQGGTPYGAV